MEQEPRAEPSSERLAELVGRAAALQEQLQTVLAELQAVLGDSDRAAVGSTEPIRVGSGVRPPTVVQRVPPVYPPEARTARVQGVVILEATIGTTGEVSDVEVLRSVPLLDEAAVAAVRQWRYEPTLVRVGSGVRPPTVVQRVPPVYPPEARTARVQGVVILEATIGTTGEVSDVEVLRSVPLLDEAAVAAVRQWRYEPTLVDGVAVPVLMTVRTLTKITLPCAKRAKPEKTGCAWMQLATLYRALS